MDKKKMIKAMGTPMLNQTPEIKGKPITYNLLDLNSEDKATELFNDGRIKILGVIGRQVGKNPGLYINIFVIHHDIPWIECLWIITTDPDAKIEPKMAFKYLPKDTFLYFPMDEDDEALYINLLKELASNLDLTKMHRMESPIE